MTEQRCKTLHKLIAGHEDWLMARILHYALERGYSAYTSTLAEPWRLSIRGLSKPLLDALDNKQDALELSPDEDYTHDAIAAFGILEAKRHRQRGISIAMFMGLFKYYRQSYLDLLDQGGFTLEENEWIGKYLHRFFDRIELGLCSEWMSFSNTERIAEMQMANRIMTNEKNKYLTLFESIPQPVILLTTEGIIDRINQAAAQWLMITDNRFYSIDTLDEINSSLQEKKYDTIFPWLQGFLNNLGQDRKMITEHRRILKNDRQLEIDVLCSAMCDISSKFNGYILIFFDRTHEYKLISDLQQMHVQLLQASKLESIGQLAAGIAHEINTPSQFVTSNLGFLEEAFAELRTVIAALTDSANTGNFSSERLHSILQDTDWSYLATEIPVAIRQSREGMARVTSIVQAMKEFSHPGSKEFEQVDINHLIELTATVARNEWKCCAELILDLNPNLPVINAQANEIGQVLLNLLVNAAYSITEKLNQAGDGGQGRITIKTRREGSWLIIDIADTGCGIPEEIHGKVFDPFFTTKSVGRGTGQGLAIAYDVISQKHNGSLNFSTVLGEGSTFSIRLPIGEPAKV